MGHGVDVRGGAVASRHVTHQRPREIINIDESNTTHLHNLFISCSPLLPRLPLRPIPHLERHKLHQCKQVASHHVQPRPSPAQDRPHLHAKPKSILRTVHSLPILPQPFPLSDLLTPKAMLLTVFPIFTLTASITASSDWICTSTSISCTKDIHSGSGSDKFQAILTWK